jgi:hypothetical protein
LHVELLVEERSAEAALANLLPRMVPSGTTWRVHPFRGKSDLLGNLPQRLRGYRTWIPPEWRIVVLVDEDRRGCIELKRHLEAAALAAGFTTRSSAGASGRFEVLNRLAIEELEAWFFGDVEAMTAAYPGVPVTLAARETYRDPDGIPGGTWEALWRVLRQAGYYRAGLPKLEVARRISAHMDPARNRSRSFQHFRDGLRAFVP